MTVQTLRVKSEDADGFAVINAHDFDHDEHELFDKKDKALVPPRPKKVEDAVAEDIGDLQKQLGIALNRATEAESERDEMKVRAEKAEAILADLRDKKGGK